MTMPEMVTIPKELYDRLSAAIDGCTRVVRETHVTLHELRAQRDVLLKAAEAVIAQCDGVWSCDEPDAEGGCRNKGHAELIRAIDEGRKPL